MRMRSWTSTSTASRCERMRRPVALAVVGDSAEDFDSPSLGTGDEKLDEVDDDPRC